MIIFHAKTNQKHKMDLIDVRSELGSSTKGCYSIVLLAKELGGM
jgi:hypothetical protein